MKEPVRNVTTNMITGFLGVGKTTAILALLEARPAGERWAVLVNEAGKTGIDGSVLARSGVTVRQIPGGCMCCATGAPMQAAVTRLLRDARPQRLLIEPSGIGHPRQLLRMLEQPPYRGVLDLRACLCLVDPRVLDDERYTGHPVFNDQLAAADLLIANKTDLCTAEQLRRFEEFAAAQTRMMQTPGRVSHGRIPLAWLDRPHIRDSEPGAPLPGGKQFYTSSRTFSPTTLFDYEELTAWIRELDAERLKAVVDTSRGSRLINWTRGELLSTSTSVKAVNRIEIIHTSTIKDADWHRLRCTGKISG